MADGSDDAFEMSYVDLFVRAERVAMRILQNRAEAEDVAAETMVRALGSWIRIRTFQVAWVTKVAANLAIDQLRRRNRPPYVSADRPDGADATDTVALVAALQRLSSRQRQALVLHHMVGLTVTDTAAVMGLSPVSVKTHMQRGAAAVRAQLGPNFMEACDVS